MRFYLDTEFIERGAGFSVDLISIGIVAEDGRSFYAHSADYDPYLASDWVKENVLPQVQNMALQPLAEIAQEVIKFVGQGKPEFWGYYCDYDWVVFCQMFGTMMDLPKGWPMYCNDLKQLCMALGNPKLPEPGKGEHDALNDALWNQKVHNFLRSEAVHEDR